jgi:hypothetical protein
MRELRVKLIKTPDIPRKQHGYFPQYSTIFSLGREHGCSEMYLVASVIAANS